MKLSEIVRRFRFENDISQREFAKRCGLSNSYISFIENERNPKTGKPLAPTIAQYKKLANGMSTTLQELFESLDDNSPVILSEDKSPKFDLQWFADSSEKSEEEKRLLSAYRCADPVIQKAALKMLEDSANDNQQKKTQESAG